MTSFYLNLIRLYFYHAVAIAMGKVADGFWFLYDVFTALKYKAGAKRGVANNDTLRALFDVTDDSIAVDGSPQNEFNAYKREDDIRARFSLIAYD
jgi:hypothetical protein